MWCWMHFKKQACPVYNGGDLVIEINARNVDFMIMLMNIVWVGCILSLGILFLFHAFWSILRSHSIVSWSKQFLVEFFRFLQTFS